MKQNLLKSFIAFFVLSSSILAQTFSVDSKDGRNQAQFISDAPFEKIVGLSSGLDATIMINANNISEKPIGKVKVPISNIKTGIDLRDEHLRGEMWLNAEKYSYTEFQLTGIKNASANKLADGKKVNATLVGKFSVHGITNDVEVPASLTYYKESEKTKARIAGNLLVANAEFDIKLSDYGIQIPSMVIGKLNEVVKISTNFVASDANTGMNPCATCGTKKSENKCNPCAAKMDSKKSNPCNPCAMKKAEMKANPCNPCAQKK